MKNFTCKPLLLIAATSLLAGCFTQHKIPPAADVDATYNGAYNQAQQDTVHLLRQGLRSSSIHGDMDAPIPLRRPATVVPVWRTNKVDRNTGRMISGHWIYIELEDEKWFGE